MEPPVSDAPSPDAAPIPKTSFLAKAWAWLLEDPSKKERDEPSEREKALAAAAQRDREARDALVAETLGPLAPIRRGVPSAADEAPEAATRADKQKAKKKKSKRPRIAQGSEARRLRARGPMPNGPSAGATGRNAKKAKRTRAGAPAAADGDEPNPGLLAAFFHRLLGETPTQDESGEAVVVPPAETDWRWALHKFFRSNVRGMAMLRSTLVVLIVLGAAWVSLFASTGYDATALLRPSDPEDPRTEYKLPFFIIESGSMMHADAPYGRLGTIDPGDIVILEKIKDRRDIQTFYGTGDREAAGAHGDVIMYLPVERTGLPDPVPIIHRAMAYIERVSVAIPNPNAAPGQPPTVAVARYTVEEFGIVNTPSITIPELGLFNYQPQFSGFITRGDNERTNNWADQALGVTPDPVPFDRVIGRYKAEVPYLGLAKIALTGQAPGLVSTDHDWCSFLAGKAACDTWHIFFVIVVLAVGIPLLLTIIIAGRRAYERHLDRVALRRYQEQEEARRKAMLAEASARDAPAPALPVHDALDLLSGRVHVGGAPRAPRTATSVPSGGVSQGGS